MDTDIISYETLIATRDSANWVMCGALATLVAALGSLGTIVCAFRALNTWKKEEKTKIKSEFKRSLWALDYAIHMMPDDWNRSIALNMRIKNSSFIVPGSSEVSVALSELKKCWHNTVSAWSMCEGLLKKTELKGLCDELSGIYVEYIQGRTNKITMLNKLSEMHSIAFIFD